MSFKTLTNKDFDTIISYLGILFSIILVIYTYLHNNSFIYKLVGVFSFTICVLWLSMRTDSKLEWNTYFHSKSINYSLIISYIILITLSSISVYQRYNLYERPLVYFFLVLLMIGIIVFEIIVFQDNFSFLILFQIILLGVSISWSQLMLFSSLVGTDPWWHQMFVLKIIDANHIPVGDFYSKLPIFHLLIVQLSLIDNLNYKYSTMLSVSLVQIICNSLFVFLVSKFIFNNYKVGLLSSLLLIVANNHILMSYWSIPNSLGAVFFLPILYLRINHINRPISSSIISLILVICLILTHAIASVCMAIILAIIYFGSFIYDFIYSKNLREKSTVSLGYCTLFVVSMLSWWTFASGSILILSKLIKWGFSRDFFITTPTKLLLQDIPLKEQFLYNGGMFLFFSISLLGCFYMMSKHGDKRTFSIALAGITPLSLGFFSLISPVSILEDRWFYFAQILLAIPLSAALMLIFNRIRTYSLKPILLSVLIIFLSFLLIINPDANCDNHLLFPNSSMRFALIDSELQTIKTVSSTYDHIIKTDKYYAGTQSFVFNTSTFDTELYQDNLNLLKNNLVLVRKEIVGKPFKRFQSLSYLDYNLDNRLQNSGYSRVYNCGTVNGYVYAD